MEDDADGLGAAGSHHRILHLDDDLGDPAQVRNNVHRRPRYLNSDLSGRPQTPMARELPAELDRGSVQE